VDLPWPSAGEKIPLVRRFVALGFVAGLLAWPLGQAGAGPWLFTADEKKSEFDIEVTLDAGLVKDNDKESTRIKGTMIAELEPDEDPETIRITHVDAQPTKSKLQFSYSFGPFGLLGKAKFTMKNFKILLDPEGAGEPALLEEDGQFLQTENVPAVTGLVNYDVDIAVLKRKGEIDLSGSEGFPEGAPESAPFDAEGQLTWDGEVPVLKFDFDIEQELTSDEFKGITVLVSAVGTVVARGERLEIEQPVLAIAPGVNGLRLSWAPSDYLLEAAPEPTFAEPERIDLEEGQTEHIVQPDPKYPQRFFRLRVR
jgi:hypothetical protein